MNFQSEVEIFDEESQKQINRGQSQSHISSQQLQQNDHVSNDASVMGESDKFTTTKKKKVTKPSSTPTTDEKKQKKQTMLSKFLYLITSDIMSKLLKFQQDQRAVFERRPIIPQKISIYQDVLFITAFKENQNKILNDIGYLNTLCTDLESRTKRKVCTIKQRMQKKVCKMTPEMILQFVQKEKDISFDAKKRLSMGSEAKNSKSLSEKASSEKATPTKLEAGESGEKLSINGTQRLQQKLSYYHNRQQQIKSQSNDGQNIELKSSPLDQQKKSMQASSPLLKTQNQISTTLATTDQENTCHQSKISILVIFQTQDNPRTFRIFNPELVHKEFARLKEEKQKKQSKINELKQLHQQLEKISQFKKSAKSIHPEIAFLIKQAQKLSEYIQNMQRNNSLKIQQLQPQDQKSIHKTVAQIQQNSKQSTQSLQKVSDFNNNQVKTTEYWLCQNTQYIKLYNSNPTTFQPLLWSQDEDFIIDELAQNFQQNKSYLELLVKYKSADLIVERILFLNKQIGPMFQAELELLKPLNIVKLTNKMTSGKNKKQEQAIIVEDPVCKV